MGATTGSDVLVAAFAALAVEEQEEAFERLGQLRLERLAGTESRAAVMLASLRRAAEHLGEPPNSTTYRQAWAELRDGGEPIESLQAMIKHYGSWRQAREALELSEASSAKLIEARFARRRLDKVWRYTEETLRETIKRCAAELGHVPQLAEFEHWRERKLELARAQGDDALHLPSAGPYRRRYGTWEKALIKFGYTPDEVAERLERGLQGRESGRRG